MWGCIPAHWPKVMSAVLFMINKIFNKRKYSSGINRQVRVKARTICFIGLRNLQIWTMESSKAIGNQQRPYYLPLELWHINQAPSSAQLFSCPLLTSDIGLCCWWLTCKKSVLFHWSVTYLFRVVLMYWRQPFIISWDS